MSSTLTAPAAAPAEATAAPARGKRKLLILAVVLALAASAGGALLLLGGDAGADPAPPADGSVVTVAEMTANVGGKGLHYARFGFAVVLAEGVDQTAVAPRFPLLRDAAITEVGAFDAAQLRTAEGVDALRNRLTVRAHEVFPDGEVLRAVLTELLVQ